MEATKELPRGPEFGMQLAGKRKVVIAGGGLSRTKRGRGVVWIGWMVEAKREELSSFFGGRGGVGGEVLRVNVVIDEELQRLRRGET